jgi:hypothetical protein
MDNSKRVGQMAERLSGVWGDSILFLWGVNFCSAIVSLI